MEKTYEERIKSLTIGSIIWGILHLLSFIFSKNLLALIPLGMLIAANILIRQKNKAGAIIEIIFGGYLIVVGIAPIILTIVLIILLLTGKTSSFLFAGFQLGVIIAAVFLSVIGVLYILAGKSTISEGKWFKQNM